MAGKHRKPLDLTAAVDRLFRRTGYAPPIQGNAAMDALRKLHKPKRPGTTNKAE